MAKTSGNAYFATILRAYKSVCGTCQGTFSGVKKGLQGMGALGQIVCDMGFSTHIRVVTSFFFFQKKSVCDET